MEDVLFGIFFCQIAYTILALTVEDEETFRYVSMGVWLPIVILMNKIIEWTEKR